MTVLKRYKILFSALVLIIISGFTFFTDWKMDGVEVKKEKVYEGSALYGYMNGGSDLFFEYGFENLLVQALIYSGNEYVLELYTMPTPEDAFGIYSMHTHRCLKADYVFITDSLQKTDYPLQREENALQYFNCLSKYQLQSVIGNKYVSIVFDAGTDQASRGAEVIMSDIISKSVLKMPEIPYDITKMPWPMSGKLKYVRGPIALYNLEDQAIDKYKNQSDYKVWQYVENPESEPIIR
ncbi:MAG: hypothetical protein M0R23_01105 [Bacteroidales bacterium]|nr:hypothetical protein [Bacteroidales bacterium]